MFSLIERILLTFYISLLGIDSDTARKMSNESFQRHYKANLRQDMPLFMKVAFRLQRNKITEDEPALLKN